QARHEGHIQAGGVDKDVTFGVEPDADINDQIDAAYRTKYRRSSWCRAQEALNLPSTSATRPSIVCWSCWSKRMSADEVKSWRESWRARLVAARESLDAATLERLRQRLDAHLWRSFPGLAAAKLAFCWPIRGEYDARRLAQKFRERGAVTALPVIVGPRQPLVF